MMKQINISGKTLGELASPHFCPRCFWVKLHCKNKLPFQIFPGIFSNIDSFSKNITREYFKRYSRLPSWFDTFGVSGKPVKVPGYKKFNVVDQKTNIRLTGVPDEILHDSDGGYFIIDYKTARFTGNQDELSPVYGVQLNAYSYIAERIGFNPVKGIGLHYYEPLTEISRATVDFHILEKGFSMRFSGDFHAVELNPDEIPELLVQARKIYDKKKPPASAEKCKNCTLLDQLLTLSCGRGSFTPVE